MSLFQRKKLHMVGVRSGALEQARGRIVMMSAVFVVCYLIVVARSVDVMVIQGVMMNKGEEVSLYEEYRPEEKQKRRADIVDRNGVLLARSLEVSSLHADPKMVLDPAKLAQDLKYIFPDLVYGDVLKKLQGKNRFVWIKRNLTPQEQEAILQLGSPALNFKFEDHRVYPHGELGGHVLGYSGIDGQGLSGVEASFNELLHNAQEPLALTIDVRIQHVLRREIAAQMQKHHAKGGAGVIMDVRDGSVLAAVSLPDFNPLDYQTAQDNAKFNRVSLGVYELGSTFKIFSTAALLEKTGGNMHQTFDVRESLKRGRFRISDYHGQKRVLTLPEVFMHSSNIGSALMGEEVGTEGLKSFYNDLGLLDQSKIEIGEVGKPIVPSPWRDLHTLTASYGHGVAVSPLQLSSAVASIVNGGNYVQPTLILNKKSLGDDNKRSMPDQKLRLISPEVSHRMRQLLRLTVTEGTGGKDDVPGYLVGGKTGTAEKPGVGGYNKKSLISSFVGVFPSNDPHYVVYVMVDEPQGIKETYGYATGGWVAAPAVKNIIASMASILKIPPVEGEPRIEESLLRYVKTKEQIKEEKKLATY